MSPVRITGVLVEKLGEPASAALREVLDAQQRESTEAAMTQCGERFERRLVEEMFALRLEMTQWRGEMREGFADLRRDTADGRFELLKWAFAFWVGQLIGVAGLMGMLLRIIPLR
jgi:hypothetical protein